MTGSYASRPAYPRNVRATSAASAIYMDSFIAPLAQELAYQNRLEPENAGVRRNLVVLKEQ